MNYETFSGRNQEEKLGSGDAISKGEIERLSFFALRGLVMGSGKEKKGAPRAKLEVVNSALGGACMK
jgi:hypothetical protein